MNTTTEQSPETAYLGRISNILSTVSLHIATETLSVKRTEWVAPENQRLGNVRIRLHELYSVQQNQLYPSFPTRIWLTFGLMFSLILEMAYPAMHGLVTTVLTIFPSPFFWNWDLKLAGSILLLIGLLHFLLVVPVITAVGAYWTFFEVATNQRLAWWLRLLIVLVAVIFIAIWGLCGASRFSDVWQHTSPGRMDTYVEQATIAIQGSSTYLVLSAFLFIIPALSHSALWLIRIIEMNVVGAALVIRWLFRSQTVESVDALSTLLSTPLPLIVKSEPIKLLDLGKEDLDALYDLAHCRRQVIQDRLIPTTLVLAFLGLLANTSLGESAVSAVISVVQNYFKASPGTIDHFIFLGQIFALMMIIGFPVGLVVVLITEALVMDYIIQSCVLAKHVKLYSQRLLVQDQASASRQLQKSCKLFGWLKSWFT